MTTVEHLRLNAEFAFSEFMTALDGVTQGQAWSVLPQGGPDFIHSDGSIHGVVLHVATCKFAYGSIGFRNSEIRWRDMAEKVETFEPDWASALDYLREAQAYWMDCWSGLTDSDLQTEIPHFSGKMWSTWRILQMVTHHDSYHGGQIALLRYAVGESTTPPPSVAEDIRKYCVDLPSW